MLTRRFCLLAATSSLAACTAARHPGLEAGALTQAQGAARLPAILPWGYPLAALDRAIAPGEDFFAFANGGWEAATSIAADRTGTGFSVEMADRNDARFAAIIAELMAMPQPPGSEGQKLRDLYLSFMDTARIEALGLAPLSAQLASIDAAESHDAIARLMARSELALPGPFNAGVGIDAKNPQAYCVTLSHDGLGLPNRDYYLSASERLNAAKGAYLAHIGQLLALAGLPEAEAQAGIILALETEIARLHWPAERRRQAEQTYNPISPAGLEGLAPGFPWQSFMADTGLGQIDRLVLREMDAFPGLAALFAATPVSAWRSYLRYHLLRGSAQFLPARFDGEVFSMFGQALGGQQQQRPREKRAIDLLNGSLDQAMGKIYVARFLPPEAKTQMTEMFENIRLALGARIARLSWMAPETKQAALSKLAAINAKIGYPDIWRDFSALSIEPDGLFANIVRLRAFRQEEDRRRLAKPVDKREWVTGPQTINAFYSPNRNEAFIPAGYMQPPLFDAFADAAVNYGAIGSIIGHEIGHGFDDQGSKYDGKGELRGWWTPQDRARFEAQGAALADQYSQFEPLPGVRINGRLTLGENLGDLVGMIVAVEAYQRSLGGRTPPVLDGFTGVQRVFLGRAQARRFKQTEEAQRRQLVQGPHSPHKFRVNGVVRNVDAWYEAFNIQPGDRLYLAPDQRVRIW